MVQPGDRVGVYRILERLGEGGMGVVFAAEDTVLQRKVALKFLSLGRSEDHLARQRLFQEAVLESGLDHPNICAVHQFCETDAGDLFIDMALATGETLREQLSRGPIAPEKAREIATQAAAGLAAAHRAGIVHRDIKPENLMVAEDHEGKALRVRILDFGVAKKEDLGLTRRGHKVGTITYMSPEQVTGQGEVDWRSDIWALGAVLYEMLTGEAPFQGDNSLQLIDAVVRREPKALQSYSFDIPEDLDELCQRCLKKDPEDRFSHENELRDLLKAGVAGGGARPKPGRIWWRASLVGLAGLLALALLVVSVPPIREALETQLVRLLGRESYWVGVLPFTSTDTADAALASGLTAYVDESLRGLATGRDSIFTMPLAYMADVGDAPHEEVRRSLGLNLAVAGHLNRGDPGPVLKLDVIDMRMEPPRALFSREFPNPDGPNFQTEAEEFLTNALRLRGEAATEGSDRPNTKSSPAFKYWVNGTGELLQMFSEDGVENAIQQFHHAIEEDSTFAPAYAGLCQAYWEKHREGGDPAVAQTAGEMCDRALHLSKDDPAALVALGEMQFRTGRPREAEETLTRAIALDDRSAEAHRWLGRVFEEQGRIDEAEAAYREAIDLQPEAWIYYSELGIMFAYLQRHEEAIAQHQIVRNLTPDNYLAYNDLGYSYLALNRLEEAEDLFWESIEKRPNPVAYRNLGYLNLRDNRYAEAVPILRRGLDLDDSDWWSWRWLANAQHWLGNTEEALAAWRRVISLVEPRLVVNASERDLLGGMAEAYAALGDDPMARQYLDRLATLPLIQPHDEFWTGRVYEMLGSREAALGFVQRALEGGMDLRTVELDPWLEGLREDPRFQEYMDGR